MDRKKLILFIVVSFLLLLIPVYIFISFFFPSLGSRSKTPSITPVPSDFKRDYSKITYLIPGKSTKNDVLKTLGGPVSETTNNNKTVLNYPTPNSSLTNTVVLENGIVAFAVEYVFSSYRGVYSDYVARYGQPELVLYSSDGVGPDWFIFLKKGIGIGSSNNEVNRVVYFVPQDKNTFIKNIGVFLNLSQTRPEPQGEILY